jgi:hypothetical protein
MGTLRFADLQTRPTEVLDLTSLTMDEFRQLAPPFEDAFQAHMADWRLDGKLRTARRDTTYQNCPLPTPEDRLLFILVYLKTYPVWSKYLNLPSHGRLRLSITGVSTCLPLSSHPYSASRATTKAEGGDDELEDLAGIHHRDGRSGTAAAQRISGHGKSGLSRNSRDNGPNLGPSSC